MWKTNLQKKWFRLLLSFLIAVSIMGAILLFIGLLINYGPVVLLYVVIPGMFAAFWLVAYSDLTSSARDQR